MMDLLDNSFISFDQAMDFAFKGAVVQTHATVQAYLFAHWELPVASVYHASRLVGVQISQMPKLNLKKLFSIYLSAIGEKERTEQSTAGV